MRKWKTMITALGAVVAVAGTPLAAHAGCGDINKNGTVDVADALALANTIAAAGDCGAGKADCDVRKDNVVDIQDLTNLVAQLAGIKTLFDACTGPGAVVSCNDPCQGGDPTCSGNKDTDTGLPIHYVPAQTITANQTWPKTCSIHITGTVFIQTADPIKGPHTVITIEPGIVIKGAGTGTANPAVLIFEPGSKIDAQGTAALPIIMTSGQAIGTRDIGDWGGLLLNGRSTVNRPGCINTAEGIPAPYGGCDATDSSGIATYVRVEFSGIEFTPNNELNVWTLNGVGTGTVLHHIQANSGFDDAIEWFGGTVNTKYFVSTASGDDGFDYQLGTTGAKQYGFMMQYGPHLQTGNQSRGIEADNSEFGFDDLPRSNPKFCNCTWIGSRDNDPNLGSEGGLFWRRGTAGGATNGIVTNFRESCIKLNDTGTSPFACTNPTTLNPTEPQLLVQSTLCFDNGGTGAFGTGNRQCSGITSDTHCSASQWYKLLAASKQVTPGNGTCSVTTTTPCCASSDCPSGETCNGLSVGTNPNLGSTWGNTMAGATRWDQVLASGGMGGYPNTVPDVRPTSTAGFPTAVDCHQIDSFFDTTNYVGAFDPNGTNWLETPLRTDTVGSVNTATWPLSFRRWISLDIH
ncbi:MAG: hypothetical protein HY270_07765 [Deltaproteobacteria bacterium]|nr:hypothetical protein [Deltaproteobacteria bacterium]